MKDARANLFKDGVNALLLRLFRFYFDALILPLLFPEETRVLSANMGH
jgi:hypothetical protein